MIVTKLLQLFELRSEQSNYQTIKPLISQVHIK